MKKIKKIQFYPTIYHLHTAYKTLVTNPPNGYQFIESQNKQKHLIIILKESLIFRKLYKLTVSLININFPLYLTRKQKISEDIDLIFSMGNLYFGDRPWVLDILDTPSVLSGYKYQIFLKEKEKIEKNLSAKNCKAIICSHETSFKFMEKIFSDKIRKKLLLIRPAVKLPGNFKGLNQKEKNPNFQILFVGSITNPADFYVKGGLEALECFKTLSKKYENTKLIVRCKIPEEIKKKYSLKNIIFIEKQMEYKDLINLYIQSDIFLMPSHQYVLMAVLEAMSYGLPIVGLDTYAVRDYLEDKRNAFVVKPSKNIPYDDPSYPTNTRSKEFVSAIKKIDRRVINDLTEKIGILINEPFLKEKMSNESLKIINKKFSIEKRNKELKKLFDKIL